MRLTYPAGVTLALWACIAGGAAPVAPQRPFVFPAHQTGLTVNPDLTLANVLQAAFERAPRRQILDSRTQEARALALSAKTLLAAPPAVSLRYQTDAVGSQEGLREWETGLEMPLWLPGQKRARQQVAKQASQGIPTAQQGLLLELAGEVREALWDIAMAENDLALAEHEWRTSQTLEKDVKRRAELGELARTDWMLATDEELGRRAAYLQAQTVLIHVQERYRTLTGLSEIPYARDEARSPLTSIIANHPLLADARAAVARAMAERDQVRSDRRGNPTLLIGSRHEKATGGGPYSNTLGVIVRVPLGSKSYSAPREATAELAVAEAQSHRDALKRQLDVALYQAAHTLEMTASALDVAARQNNIAQENLRLTRIAFEAGETDLVGLLRIQARAFAAERAVLSRKLELGREIARYNQAVGVLP